MKIFILICTWYIIIHRFFISLKSLRKQTGSRRWDSDLFLTPVFFKSFNICSTNPFDRFRLCLSLPIGPEIKKINNYLIERTRDCSLAWPNVEYFLIGWLWLVLWANRMVVFKWPWLYCVWLDEHEGSSIASAVHTIYY